MVTLWSHFSSHSSHFSNTQDVTYKKNTYKCQHVIAMSLQCQGTIRYLTPSDLFDLFVKESRWNLIAWHGAADCKLGNSAQHDMDDMERTEHEAHDLPGLWQRLWQTWSNMSNQRRTCRTCRTCRTSVEPASNQRRTSQFEWFKERFKIHRPGTCTPALLFPFSSFSIQACFHWNSHV